MKPTQNPVQTEGFNLEQMAIALEAGELAGKLFEQDNSFEQTQLIAKSWFYSAQVHRALIGLRLAHGDYVKLQALCRKYGFICKVDGHDSKEYHSPGIVNYVLNHKLGLFIRNVVDTYATNQRFRQRADEMIPEVIEDCAFRDEQKRLQLLFASSKPGVST